MERQPQRELDVDLRAEGVNTPVVEGEPIGRTEAGVKAEIEREPVVEYEPVVEGETLLEGEVEVVDGLPVISGGRSLARSAALPAVQTAAAAATGFVVGAATLALLRRRDSRHLSRELRDLRGRLDSPRRVAEPPLEPGQSYLVHVRVFSRPPHQNRG